MDTERINHLWFTRRKSVILIHRMSATVNMAAVFIYLNKINEGLKLKVVF